MTRIHAGCGGEIRYSHWDGSFVSDGVTAQRCLRCGLTRTRSVEASKRLTLLEIDMFPTEPGWEPREAVKSKGTVMDQAEQETFERAEKLRKLIQPRADMIGVKVGILRHAVGKWYVFAKRQGMPQWTIRLPADIERMAEAIPIFEETRQRGRDVTRVGPENAKSPATR